MTYVKFERLLLKNHQQFTERWVQDRITEDPALLGLGDVILKDKERIQPRAGRLDMLLQGADTSRRYEVEIQLGATDEFHIIRTIEYLEAVRVAVADFVERYNQTWRLEKLGSNADRGARGVCATPGGIAQMCVQGTGCGTAPIGSKAAGAAFKDTWTLSDVDVEWINLIEAKHPALYPRSARGDDQQ